MRLFPVIVALALFAIAPACAEDGQNPNAFGNAPKGDAESLNVGQGVICNTLEQAKRLVSLQNDGHAIKDALGAVNQEAHNPTACGPAVVAFRIAEQVDGDRLEGRSVHVVKIVVSAISVGEQWSEVPEIVQFAIMPPPGIEI